MVQLQFKNKLMWIFFFFQKHRHHQKQEEEIQNMVSTIGHLDFKSAQNRNMIQALRVQNRRYRKQVELLDFYAQRYSQKNKFLKQELENLK